jgi:hypothetical protein
MVKRQVQPWRVCSLRRSCGQASSPVAAETGMGKAFRRTTARHVRKKARLLSK